MTDIPLWDQSHDPATEFGVTAQDIADFYTADNDASTAAFELLQRAVDNMIGSGTCRVNHIKAQLYLAAAIATGFDCTGYNFYTGLVARYGEPE